MTWDGSYLAEKHQASVALGPLLKLTDANWNKSTWESKSTYIYFLTFQTTLKSWNHSHSRNVAVSLSFFKTFWYDMSSFGLVWGKQSNCFFNAFAFPHCTRPFFPWRDEIFESQPNSGKDKNVSYYCFDVIYWYFHAKRTQKQLNRFYKTFWQTHKSLAVQWACTLCLYKPIHPSICFWKQNTSSKAPSIRPVCIMSVCLAFKEKKQRYQSTATMLLLQTPPHFVEKAGIIAGVYSKSWIYS